MAKAKKLPSGSWRVLVYDYTDENGKRHYQSFTSDDPSAKGKREAEYAAAEYAKTKESKQRPETLSFSEALEKYIVIKSNILSPSTIREYRRMQANYYQNLNELPLRKLNQALIQTWVNQFAVTHSPKTVRNAHGLLTAVLDLYYPSLVLRTSLPQKVKPTLYVPTDDDIKRLLAHFRESDTNMEIAVYLAAFGTLRRSEICGLTAGDVSGSVIHVNKALVKDAQKNWQLKTTKTVSSDRYVEMPGFVIELLPHSGRLVTINPDQVSDRFRAGLKALNLPPFRFHDLRHYAASIMHALGVPDQYIMSRGGWSSDQTLKNIYRGTIQSYTEQFTARTLSHFDNMQHEMQHDKQKTP